MERWGGLLETFIVLAFLVGWGVLELVGKRLDRRREEAQRQAAEAAEGEREPGRNA